MIKKVNTECYRISFSNYDELTLFKRLVVGFKIEVIDKT